MIGNNLIVLLIIFIISCSENKPATLVAKSSTAAVNPRRITSITLSGQANLKVVQKHIVFDGNKITITIPKNTIPAQLAITKTAGFAGYKDKSIAKTSDEKVGAADIFIKALSAAKTEVPHTITAVDPAGTTHVFTISTIICDAAHTCTISAVISNSAQISGAARPILLSAFRHQLATSTTCQAGAGWCQPWQIALNVVSAVLSILPFIGAAIGLALTAASAATDIGLDILSDSLAEIGAESTEIASQDTLQISGNVIDDFAAQGETGARLIRSGIVPSYAESFSDLDPVTQDLLNATLAQTKNSGAQLSQEGLFQVAKLYGKIAAVFANEANEAGGVVANTADVLEQTIASADEETESNAFSIYKFVKKQPLYTADVLKKQCAADLISLVGSKLPAPVLEQYGNLFNISAEQVAKAGDFLIALRLKNLLPI